MWSVLASTSATSQSAARPIAIGSPVIGPQTYNAECTAGETGTDTRSPGNVWLRAESARRFCAVIG